LELLVNKALVKPARTFILQGSGGIDEARASVMGQNLEEEIFLLLFNIIIYGTHLSDMEAMMFR
jgi:hypothetical protein